MRSKVVKIWSLFLLFPIKLSVSTINLIRRSTKSKFLDAFMSDFRTKMHNDFSKLLDKSYLVRHSANSTAKLTYVDIGARDGMLDIISKNIEKFQTIILCEGEPAEAKKLRDQGYLVIDKFLGDIEGSAKFFYIAGHPGASSLKRPGTPFLHLFSKTHYDIYTNYTESDVITSTLDVELKKLNVSSIDFIKIDVQGYELAVIKGLTTVSPLFWEVEILPLPTYQDTPYGTTITAELVNRGYISFRQSDRMCKDGIYIYSNEMFMPDYSTEFGKKLILDNLDKWRTMMELFDLRDLGIHIEAIMTGK